MRYILMRLLEGDEKTNAGDTLLAVASQPCQLGCAATANKSLPLPRITEPLASYPISDARGNSALGCLRNPSWEGCFYACHFSKREEHLSQLLRLISSLYVIKCDL